MKTGEIARINDGLVHISAGRLHGHVYVFVVAELTDIHSTNTLLCCDGQASPVTWSLGVTVRDSFRKMLVLLDLARRKFREILEHGVRRVAS